MIAHVRFTSPLGNCVPFTGKEAAGRVLGGVLVLGRGQIWGGVLRKSSEISPILEPPMASALFSTDHTKLVVEVQKPNGVLRAATRLCLRSRADAEAADP